MENSVKTYQSKPVIKEAIQFTGENFDFCQDFLGNSMVNGNQILKTFEIKTLEGLMKASAGDYIIRGITGEFYLCKPEIFLLQYNEVPTPPPHGYIEGPRPSREVEQSCLQVDMEKVLKAFNLNGYALLYDGDNERGIIADHQLKGAGNFLLDFFASICDSPVVFIRCFKPNMIAPNPICPCVQPTPPSTSQPEQPE